MLAAAVVASSLVSAYGQSRAASAQAKAAKQMARAKRKQAAELLKQAEINKERMRVSGVQMTKEQQASFASAGVTVNTGSTLAVMNDSINKVEQGITDMINDARSKASALRAGADVDMRLSSDIQEASKYQIAGTLLGGATDYARVTGRA